MVAVDSVPGASPSVGITELVPVVDVGLAPGTSPLVEVVRLILLRGVVDVPGASPVLGTADAGNSVEVAVALISFSVFEWL